MWLTREVWGTCPTLFFSTRNHHHQLQLQLQDNKTRQPYRVRQHEKATILFEVFLQLDGNTSALPAAEL